MSLQFADIRIPRPFSCLLSALTALAFYSTPILADDCSKLLSKAPLKGLIEARESFDARDINESRFRNTISTLVGTDCDRSSLEPYFRESEWLFLAEVFESANSHYYTADQTISFCETSKGFLRRFIFRKNAAC